MNGWITKATRVSLTHIRLKLQQLNHATCSDALFLFILFGHCSVLVSNKILKLNIRFK